MSCRGKRRKTEKKHAENADGCKLALNSGRCKNRVFGRPDKFPKFHRLTVELL